MAKSRMSASAKSGRIVAPKVAKSYRAATISKATSLVSSPKSKAGSALSKGNSAAARTHKSK